MRTKLFILIAFVTLAGCAGTPRISALHDPLYRAENHTSTITARATETRDGIASVSITAIVGDLTACTESLTFPSLIPCRTNASAMGVVCVFPNTKTQVSCSLPIGVTPRRLISYTASARSAASRSASTQSVTYAAGAPLTSADVRILGLRIPIAWETARPVVWRTDVPSNTTNRADKLDFGFVPDPDMPTYRAFTDDLQPLALTLFYNDTNEYSRWTRTWKNVFNLWAGPAGANGEGCTRTLNAPASTVMAAFDGTAILHRNDFRDCASINLGGGAGTTQTNLGDAAWVLLHEAGHFMFGLGDEYVGGGNWSASMPRNVYDSESDCQSNSTANSLPSSACVQIGTSGTWRNDDGQSTTMEDRTLASDFRTLSGVAMNNLLSKCLSGSCF